MKLFWTYLNYKRKTFVVCLVFAALFAASFYLYHLSLKAVLYPAALCFAIGIIFFLVDFLQVCRRHRTLTHLQAWHDDMVDGLPSCQNIIDEDYHALINTLCHEAHLSDEEAACRYRDMVDYYTVWAHQIKTPIAAMRLNLQSEDTPQSRRLLQDLKHIEQYVEMVLTFLRLGSDSTDYIFKTYDLDSIVRPAVRKFAGEFIGKKLTLRYAPLNVSVITDEKWLSFVIEQIISNAVKYTDAGEVSVYMESPKTLCIADTGIGIAPEDLPRIFENGYTGFNGRMDKRASGIGLYLCKQICDRLGHGLYASSELGRGTILRIDLHQNSIAAE